MRDLHVDVDDGEARSAQLWANHLGIDVSDLLREALRRHLAWLNSEDESWPGTLAIWGETEDWSDWADAAR